MVGTDTCGKHFDSNPEVAIVNWTKLTLSICLASAALPGWALGDDKVPAATGQGRQSAPSADEELLRLQTAADSDPSNLKTQLTLARRLFENEKYPEAWQRLRGVYEKSPEDQVVLIGLQAVLDGYKRQGRLNVGTSEKQILELLGTPHQTRNMPWGIRHVYGMMAVDFRQGKVYELIKLIGATNELFDASHVVDVDLGSSPAWHVGMRQKGDGLTTAFLFREGESIAKWNELVTIERFVKQAEGKTMSDVLNSAQEKIKADNADAQFIIAEQDASTAIFGVSYPAREGQLARQQIVRLWLGSRDVHRLAYTHQGAIPGEQEGQKWFKTFKNASLKPYDPSVSATSLASSPRNQVKNLAESIRIDLRKAAQYRPTEKALSAIAATEDAKKMLLAYSDSVYKELDKAGSPASPNQTEIIVFGPALEELPGGYNNVRQHLKSDVKFYGFKYVAPGETRGMSFDGAFEVDGQWYFLPKAHRAFR